MLFHKGDVILALLPNFLLEQTSANVPGDAAPHAPARSTLSFVFAGVGVPCKIKGGGIGESPDACHLASPHRRVFQIGIFLQIFLGLCWL